MMTPQRFPFHLSTPKPDLWHWEPIAGAMCGGPLIVHRVTAEQNHGPSDC